MATADPNVAAQMDALADKTAMISARLKQIYQKSVLPCEKKYRYDYFYESPLLSDVEFDCTFSFPYSWFLPLWRFMIQRGRLDRSSFRSCSHDPETDSDSHLHGPSVILFYFII